MSRSPTEVCRSKIRSLKADSTLSRQKGVRNYIRMCAELSPDNAELHDLHAQILLMIGEIDGALAASETALSLQPDTAAFSYTAGMALVGARRMGQAYEAFMRVIALDANHTDAKVLAALLLSPLGSSHAADVAVLLDEAEAGIRSLRALKFATEAALLAGLYDRALRTAVQLWYTENQRCGPVDWPHELMAVPDDFIRGRFVSELSRFQRPRFLACDPLLEAKKLLLNGAGRAEVLERLAYLLPDAAAPALHATTSRGE